MTKRSFTQLVESMLSELIPTGHAQQDSRCAVTELKNPSPEESADVLVPGMAFLRDYETEELRKIVALMYSGRDDEDFADCYGDWRDSTREMLLERLTKPSVGEDLRRGLERARQQNLDLDRDWSKPFALH